MDYQQYRYFKYILISWFY